MENTPNTIKKNPSSFTGIHIYFIFLTSVPEKFWKTFVYHMGRHLDTETATMNTTEIMLFCKTLVFLWVQSPVLNLWWLCSELFTCKTIFCLFKTISWSHPEKFNCSWFCGSFSWYHCKPYHFFQFFLQIFLGDVPGGPVAETLHSQWGVLGLIQDWGTRSCMPQLRPDAAK